MTKDQINSIKEGDYLVERYWDLIDNVEVKQFYIVRLVRLRGYTYQLQPVDPFGELGCLCEVTQRMLLGKYGSTWDLFGEDFMLINLLLRVEEMLMVKTYD